MNEQNTNGFGQQPVNNIPQQPVQPQNQQIPPVQPQNQPPVQQPVQGQYQQPVQGQYQQPIQQPVQGQYQAPVQGQYQTAPTGYAPAPPAPPVKKSGGKTAVIIILAAIIGIALIAIIVLALGKNDPAKKFYGQWTTTADFTQELKDNMGEVTKYISDDFKFELTLNFTFNDDGTYKMQIDEDKLGTTMDDFKAELKVVILKYFRDNNPSYAKYSDKQLIALFDKAFEGGYDAYVDKLFKENIDVDSLRKSYNVEGKYKVDEGKLYLSAGKNYNVDESAYFLYEIKTDTEIVFNDYIINGKSDDSNLPMPVTLHKI